VLDVLVLAWARAKLRLPDRQNPRRLHHPRASLSGTLIVPAIPVPVRPCERLCRSAVVSQMAVSPPTWWRISIRNRGSERSSPCR